MEEGTLAAQKRQLFGRKVKKLRREGKLPAVVYGKKVDSIPIEVILKDFEKVYAAAGETNLIKLKIDKETKPRPVLAANLTKDPVTDRLLHIDFHQVDLTEKVTVAVPIVIKGESPAVKEKGAVLITTLDEVKVEALPADLPDEYVVDVSGLKEYGESLLIKDLQVDKGKVTVLADEDETIVTIQQPKEEEVVPPPEVAEEAAEEVAEGEEVQAPEETQETKEE